MRHRWQAVMVLALMTAGAAGIPGAFAQDPTSVSASAEERWLSHQSLSQGIWRIDDNGQDNIYLVEGDTAALVIDTGLGYADIRAYAATLTNKPLIAINTHGHPDHAGGNAAFDAVHIHPAEHEALAHYTSDAVMADTFQRFAGIAMPERLRKAHQPQPRLVDIHDGDVLDLGNRVIHVIHVPGHSPGSIALYDANTGSLFSGDMANEHIWLQVPYVTSIQDFLESTRKLIAYPKPVSQLLPGHGGALPPAHLQRLEAATSHLLSGHCPATPYSSPLGPFQACEHEGVVLVYPSTEPAD